MLPSTVENNSLPAVPFNEEENRGCGGLMAMSPANFGIVMATGIVSLAAHLLGKDAIAQALFLLNNVLFAILCVLSILRAARYPRRSEEHTSELQSLMRISYAVFCLKKKNNMLKDIMN